MIRYQGESIDFYVSINDISTVEKWTDFDFVDIYFYTNSSRVTKFRTYTTNNKPAGSALSLTMSDDKKTLSGIIPSANTKTMQGALKMDIAAVIVDDPTNTVYIKSMATGIDIEYAPIKAEL